MFDFCITDSGELIYDNNSNNFLYLNSDDLLRQKCICRIKSVTKDWFNVDYIGSDIEKFLGELNNKNTLDLIIKSIEQALLYDELVGENSLFFIPKICKNRIELLIFIKEKRNNNPIVINMEIDVVSGVKIKYDINTQ
ncbi:MULTISPECIES: hypothetical protein [unclassified Clostridioides]|uniref:hypothetical protein n=1 Tax=unclassified Clostridioides TaxID=2635829 RepID=UPI001D1004FA|nr:hypothetical protein [Clostridioides sp. ES-S-0001-02]MCC0638955.1 hypothetical protein [Clostridioides sp. ES-S-0049-03]MCC0657318.1 hypothetical protein [Clostridioides sp. ES-S-0123-01]MCC0672723.1 hypothetical protein [Clostridioides sp. ES-S-0145-01]MCC0675345.1 hypothetical protein [Clostridioides sp. ES-W-0018-02]MCC0679961.1 hypothetical protein [Clostridioides sp. ES-S-0005-03]MCC0709846.1 hypothetical protein [Clostridioides sp. ES-W-0017-02]UDN46196.1 hypothetical protein JJJ25